jgi:hypothetical protein
MISAVNSEVVAEPKSHRTSEKDAMRSFRMTLRTTHIGGSDLPGVNNIEGGGGNVVGNRVESRYSLSRLVDFDIRKPNDGGLTQGA